MSKLKSTPVSVDKVIDVGFDPAVSFTEMPTQHHLPLFILSSWSDMSLSTDSSLGAVTRIVCRGCLPVSLPHVMRLIDAYHCEFFDQKVFEAACAGGAPISTLEVLLARTPAPDWGQAAYVAAQGGHLHVIQWMLSERQDNRGPWRSDFERAPEGAAKHGHLEILMLLDQHGVKYFGDTMCKAAADGHLEVVKWAYKYHHPFFGVRLAMEEASEHGHLDVIQWLLEKGAPVNNVMSYAASGGHLNVVQWLYEYQNNEIEEWALDRAVGEGHLDVAQWLYDRGARDCSSFAIERAAETGNSELVKWLHEHFSDRFTPRVMDQAAWYCHLDVVKWLHENRHEGCTTEAMDRAASEGRLDIVQWLHIHRHEGCTTQAMNMAASNGHLDVVQWLHTTRTEGCTGSAMIYAAQMGHLDVVRYLYDSNIDRSFGEDLRGAADQGCLEMIIVLLEALDAWVGLSVPCIIESSVEKTLKAIGKGEVSARDCALRSISGALEWFRSHSNPNCECVILQMMVCRGYPNIARRFLENISEEDYSNCLAMVISEFRDYRPLMRWIIVNGPLLDMSPAKKLATQELRHKSMKK